MLRGKQHEMRTSYISFKSILFRGVVTAILLIILGVVYWMDCKIPNGIIVGSVDAEAIQLDYKNLILDIEEYQEGEAYGIKDARLITAKPSFAQMLSYTLREQNPDGYVRNLSLERRMRLFGIELIASILFIEFLIGILCFLLSRSRGQFSFLLHIFEAFFLCFLIKSRGIIPTTWIPDKLIYLGAWRERIQNSIAQLRNMGELPCTSFQQCQGLHRILLALFTSILSLAIATCFFRRKRNKI